MQLHAWVHCAWEFAELAVCLAFGIANGQGPGATRAAMIILAKATVVVQKRCSSVVVVQHLPPALIVGTWHVVFVKRRL